MKKTLLYLTLLTFLILSGLSSPAHTWEIRVNQNTDGSLTWYIQTYHYLSETSCVTQANQSGLIINGIQYSVQSVHSGSIAGLSPTVFGSYPPYASYGRNAYGVIHTPFLGTNLSVSPYSNVACWANPGIAANGNFTPPPPPVCTSFPVNGFTNTLGLPGYDNGTACDQTDDTLPVALTVNHQSCGSITGDGKFSVIVDPSGANITYGPFDYSTGISTDVTFDVPYGFSAATLVRVVDNDFPGNNITHTLSGFPDAQYNGVPDGVAPTVLTQDITVALGANGQIAISASEIDNGSSDNCGISNMSLDVSSFGCTDVGNHTVTLSVTDNSGNTATGTAVVTVTASDVDGDGVPDACDQDIDNDGILNINECTTSNFFWSNPPLVSGNTATGTINGIAYTYTSSVNVTTTSYMFNHAAFPSSYNVPNDNPTIQNIYASSNTLTFASPMTNPVLVFASIGQPNLPVTINFSNDIQVLWSTAVVQNSSTQITGNEGFAIIRLNGTYSSVSFDYLNDENWVNFAFGADFYTYCDTDADGIADYLDPDSDNDGCYDAIEGSLGLSPDQTPNGQIAGAVDANGVPVLAGSQGQEVGTSNDYSVNCFCELGIDEANPIAVVNNLTIQLDIDNTASITVDNVDGGSSDNCGIINKTISKSEFNCADIGDNLVTLTVLDAAGNIGQATATVTVMPAPLPEANDDEFNEASCQSFTFSDADLLANDTDPAGQTLKVDFVGQPSTGSFVDNGDGTYTYTPSVNTNHSVTLSYTIKRDDGTTVFTGNGHYYEFIASPGITWTAAKIDAETHYYQGLQGYLATITSAEENTFASSKLNGQGWIGASDSQQEGVWKWVTGPEAGTEFSGQFKTGWCSANTASGINGNYAHWSGGEPNDCGSGEDYAHFLTNGYWNDFPNDVGSQIAGYVVEYGGNAQDCNINVTASANITINLTDNTPPVVVTQNLTVALDASGQAAVTPAQINNGSSDNCGIAALSLDVSSFDCSNVGDNTVTLTVTDVNGNSATGTATVTILDNIVPSITCSGSITSYNTELPEETLSFTIPSGGGTNSWAPWNYYFTDPLPAGATITGIDLTFTAVDQGWGYTGANANLYVADTYIGSGQLLHYSQTHTLNYSGSVPAYNYGGTNALTLYHVGWPGWESHWQGGTMTIHYTTSEDCMAYVEVTAPEVTDNCSGLTLANNFNGTADASGMYPIGETTVEWTVTDASGNMASCSQTITVIDNTPPDVLTNDLVVALDDQGSAFITEDEIDGGSSDNCGIESMVLSQTSFDCSSVGDNEVELIVTDIHGNVAGATAIVTIQDNTPPVVYTQNVTIQLNASGSASIEVAQIDAGSTDACGIESLSLDVTSFDCSNVGFNTVTLTAIDINGNIASETATVTVEDHVAPVVHTQDITVQLDASGSVSITADDIDNGSSDACGIESLSLDVSSFDCANVGANTVTLTATDVNGNISLATATVTVEDHVAPVVLTQDITVQLDASGSASITTNDIDAGSSDACGIESLALDITAFDCANVGSNTVTLTALDVNGNAASTTATVTVEDNVAPVVLTQNITVQLDVYGQVAITTGDIDNGSSDACGIELLSLDVASFDCSNVGNNVVTLTAVDVNGNSASETATVTVEDNVAPDAVCQSVTVHLDEFGQASITPEDIDGGSTDACGIASLEASQTDFDCAHVGDNAITLTVTDVNGNSSECVATVTVINDLPEINTFDVSEVVNIAETVFAEASYTDVNLASVEFDWGNGEVTAGTVDATSGMVYGDHVYPETGLYDVTVTITDICGKTATETFSYVVIYDPCAGHVTGGGYIGNKNNFGFNAKYDAGEEIPKGNVNFKDKDADIHFKSDNADWLMVNNDQAIFKGHGTLNDEGSYNYIVSFIDGDISGNKTLDLFRIIIWDENDIVLYDNQSGDPDVTRAIEQIGNGSLKIHKGCGAEDDDAVVEDTSSTPDDTGNNSGGNNGKGKGKSNGKSMAFGGVGVNLYPNPVLHTLNLKFSNLEDQPLVFSIVDMTGRVYTRNENLEVTGSKSTVDISQHNLKQGNYMMMIRNDDNSIHLSKPFLKK